MPIANSYGKYIPIKNKPILPSEQVDIYNKRI